MSRNIKNKEELENELNEYRNRLQYFDKSQNSEKKASQDSAKNSSIINRLQKIEQFYQSRTRILEERIEFLEKETDRQQQERDELQRENQ